MTDRSLFLDVAHRIGRRIVRQATWEKNTCTWTVMAPDYDNLEERRALPETASGVLYQGTAGIALFLHELYRHTQDEDVKETAQGAIQHALSEAEELPPTSFGFYSGRVGIAYAAVAVGRHFDRPEFVERALDLLVPLEGNEGQDGGLDVIAGAAGAIPALLQLGAWLDAERPARMALSLGEHLIEQAVHEPVGWSWPMMRSSAVRHLNGYAHGASGIGHAFLELCRATGAERYRYVAEQAFLYERQFFDEETSNWPDLRHSELSTYLRKDRDELQAAIREGELPPYQETYMSAWCHGAPGIGLTRLRAYELFGHDTHAHEARAALEATKASLDPSWNYSLCHGMGGNCETLLYASSVFDEPEWREQAEQAARWGKKYYENEERWWPCGTVNAAPDPSLMLGEAGIGYFYLRLFSAETPSCLFLRAREALDLPAPEPNGYADLRRDYVETYFERTLHILSQQDKEVSLSLGRSLDESLHRSDVERVYDQLEAHIASLEEPVHTLMEDATRLDRVRYEMQKGVSDFTREMIESLRRPEADDVSWDAASFQLAPHTQVVQRRWDWESWLSRPREERPAHPEENRSAYLLYRSNNRIRIREIGLFTELVLRGLETHASLSQIEQFIRDRADLDGISSEVLRQKIIEQLKNAYEIGAVQSVRHTREKIAVE